MTLFNLMIMTNDVSFLQKTKM